MKNVLTMQPVLKFTTRIPDRAAGQELPDKRCKLVDGLSS